MGDPCSCHDKLVPETVATRFIRRSVAGEEAKAGLPVRKTSGPEPKKQLFRPHSASLPHIRVNDAAALYSRPPSGLVLQEPVFCIGGKTSSRFTISQEGQRFSLRGLHDEERAESFDSEIIFVRRKVAHHSLPEKLSPVRETPHSPHSSSSSCSSTPTNSTMVRPLPTKLSLP